MKQVHESLTVTFPRIGGGDPTMDFDFQGLINFSPHRRG